MELKSVVVSLIKIVKIDYHIFSAFVPSFYVLEAFGIVLKLVIMSMNVLKLVNAIIFVIVLKIVAIVAMIVWNSLIAMMSVLALVAIVVNAMIVLDAVLAYIVAEKNVFVIIVE